MANLNYSRIPEDDVLGYVSPVGVSGIVMTSRRLFGDNGSAANGDIGQWYRSQDTWKTFFLYPLDLQTALTTEEVVIEACMEIKKVGPETSFAITLATLNAASPNFSLEHPWRWVRARVVVAGAGVQVGMHALS